MVTYRGDDRVPPKCARCFFANAKACSSKACSDASIFEEVGGEGAGRGGGGGGGKGEGGGVLQDHRTTKIVQQRGVLPL